MVTSAELHKVKCEIAGHEGDAEQLKLELSSSLEPVEVVLGAL